MPLNMSNQTFDLVAHITCQIKFSKATFGSGGREWDEYPPAETADDPEE